MHPPPPGQSNIGFSTIKTEPLDANDLTNSMKKSGATKRHFNAIGSNTLPKKKVASAAEFKTLMTPKKPKTSLKSKLINSKDCEASTFKISNQEYLCSINNIKVDKMKTVHDFFG